MSSYQNNLVPDVRIPSLNVDNDVFRNGRGRGGNHLEVDNRRQEELSVVGVAVSTCQGAFVEPSKVICVLWSDGRGGESTREK